MLKTQCPRCIGDNRLSREERTFKYSRPAIINNHFNRAHLLDIQLLEKDKLIFYKYPLYVEKGVKLGTVDEFRNHIYIKYGV